MWTERTRAANPLNMAQFGGFWVIKVADFVDDPSNPHLENTRTITPNVDGFFETGGFSPDSAGLLFSSAYTTANFFHNQIFFADLASDQVVQLTNDRDAYNEHPRFTPDGRIMWMSSRGHRPAQGGTDWWILEADGSSPERLSYFNAPTRPEYVGQQVYTGPVSVDNWSADGTYFYGDVELNLLTGDSEIVRVSVSCG